MQVVESLVLRTGDLVESEAQLKKENNGIIGCLSNNVLFIFASSLRYSLLNDTTMLIFFVVIQSCNNSQTSVLH